MQGYLNGLRTSSISHLESDSGRQWWRVVRQQTEPLSQFSGFESLVDFFARRTDAKAYFEERDRVLRALFAEHRDGATPQRTHDLFVVLYFPLLARIAGEFSPRGKGRSLDASEIAPEIVHAFLHLLSTLNLATNRDVHTSLTRRTRGHFLQWADREFKHSSATDWQSGGDDADEPSAGPAHTLGDLAADKTRGGGWELDVSELVFDELRRRDVIDEHVHRLLIGTVVYQKQLKQLVAESEHAGKPLSYEAAKKRLQRAQRQIRDYLDRHDLDLTDLVQAGSESFFDSDVPSAQKPGRRPPKASK